MRASAASGNGVARFWFHVSCYRRTGSSQSKRGTQNQKHPMGTGCTTNDHESYELIAERLAEVRDRFSIQSCVVEVFVAGFCQPVQTPKLIQQAIAFDLADADDLVQL
jgi:hypothetical protein